MNQSANKYARGVYAVCSSCKERPCSCPEHPSESPASGLAVSSSASNVVSVLRPKSGNAIPFEAFDQYPDLSPYERLLLLYLCRLTIGYGHHTGDLLSLGQLGERSGLRRTALRAALNGLERRGLIERNRRYERASRERGTTHIQVTLRSEVGSEGVEVGRHTTNQVGRYTTNRRSPHDQPLVATRPYLKGSPKSSPKEIQAPAQLVAAMAPIGSLVQLSFSEVEAGLGVSL